LDNRALKQVLWSQFGAALQMLENALNACPPKVWAEPSHGRPFWYLAFHTLFFLDLYLSDSPKGFAPPSPFTLSEFNPKREMPETEYSREQLLGYLRYGVGKCRKMIESLTEEKILAKCGFRWVDFSVGELVIYNIRHVQHHTAQLNLLLRQNAADPPGWVFKGADEMQL